MSQTDEESKTKVEAKNRPWKELFRKHLEGVLKRKSEKDAAKDAAGEQAAAAHRAQRDFGRDSDLYGEEGSPSFPIGRSLYSDYLRERVNNQETGIFSGGLSKGDVVRPGLAKKNWLMVYPRDRDRR